MSETYPGFLQTASNESRPAYGHENGSKCADCNEVKEYAEKSEDTYDSADGLTHGTLRSWPIDCT